MTMNELVNLLFFFLAGVGMGLVYFGGLWWTVKRLARSPKPHLLTLGSFAVRSGFILAGLYWIAREGRWEAIVVSLLGVLGARLIFIRLLSPEKKQGRTFSEG